ncbi:MAG: HAD hydrolase-like protein [Legionella sp.]|nr:HAD hydrolase-like protein [Legionella sp.]
MHQKNFLSATTCYIGDEARDVEAAHAAKIKSLAVSWGFNSYSRLVQANPNQLVTNIEQLLPILCEIEKW